MSSTSCGPPPEKYNVQSPQSYVKPPERLEESQERLGAPNYTTNIDTDRSLELNTASSASHNTATNTDAFQRMPDDITLPPISKYKVTQDDVDLAKHISHRLKIHGLCILSSFLSSAHAEQIYNEVQYKYHKTDSFKTGKVIMQAQQSKIRGDKVLWVGHEYKECRSVKLLCDRLDKIILLCDKEKEVRSRTKGMVACYPGGGTCYRKHVDNPMQDGRHITALYYMNKGWEKDRDGGTLRIYPKDKNGSRLDVVPNFNSLFLFYSDGRNPHEVLPTHKERFAITHWYFAYDERRTAIERMKQKKS